MKVTIQNCSKVTVIGQSTRRNCKAVYNITTGDIYASVLDAANTLGVSSSAVSIALDDDKPRTCNGMRLCFLSKMTEHLEEITEQNRVRSAKVAAYDADVERRNAIAKAQVDVQKHEEKVAELRRQLEWAEGELSAAKHGLLELQSGN